jgi:two-component system LytT family response regulator
MLKTILVDDEQRGINTLKKIIELNCPQLKIVAECNNALTAFEKINLLEPQLLFLDISMPGKNGFELLKEFETISFEIIFVTAHNEYSLEAFKYSAIDYLMKPVDEDMLIDSVKRAERRIIHKSTSNNIETFLYNLHKTQTPQNIRLCVPSSKGFQVIDLSEIVYCEAENSYTVFHLKNGQQLVASKSIIEYEQLLEDSCFCRIHKSFLVNLSHIKEYLRGEGGSVLLTNDHEIEVSRRKKEIFITKMKVQFRY